MEQRPQPQEASAQGEIFYHNDIFGSRVLARILHQYLHGDVLEVGAGGGAITQELSRRCDTVLALEPSAELFQNLQKHTQDLANVTVMNRDLQTHVQETATNQNASNSGFDAIVYVNVLEHIEGDVAELSLATSLLKPNGRVLIVVPAHQWLYARVDKLTGHHRRYSMRSLRQVFQQSGLVVDSLRYFDAVGLLPYLVIYKWLRNTSTEGPNATIYSRVILPISLVLYQIFRGHLVGKNLVAVAKSSPPNVSQ